MSIAAIDAYGENSLFIVGFYVNDVDEEVKIICIDCLDENGEEAHVDYDSEAIFYDDIFTNYVTCDFCGELLDVLVL